jgi:3D (Asp-Asp-Asp) domain-containing protein
MKSLYRGGAVTAAALIVTTLFVYARPSIAETNPTQQPASQQKKEESQNPTPGAQSASPNLSTNADVATTAAPIAAKVVELAEISPAAEAPAPTPARPVQTYVATAYSLRGRTASGRLVAKGLIAADPSLLPLGSRVRVDAGSYSGEYLVADTGGAVRGRHIDIWIPTSREAMRFGRRSVKLTVLSLGAARKALRRKSRR